ncbi:LacI family DNA-binding transcriptional regulator [Limibacter armeniacum]|uniref:LacI family DNA-binding transcriptional regulator n=1 Tax=Limibacter armeniacum TaxID=466084 RepID=UPI002FE52814
MKKGQLTMQDIADKLGISKSTVSRALKDHPDISEKTKKAVMQLANELDFQPNSLALSLRHNRSNIIGVIVPEIVHHFFANVISGIQAVAYREGYNVMICLSNEDFDQEVKDAFALQTSRVDGILMSISKETTDFEHLKKIHRKGTPIVFFDRACDEMDVSKVISDDFGGAFSATQHLIEQGCKQVVHLAGPATLALSKSRKDGYLAALKENGIAPDDNLIVECPAGTMEDGEDKVNQLLASGLKIDGIFANNDIAAIGAMKAAKKHGLRIPEDIAVVGFSDWQIASIVDPALSSVAQPGYEMGRIAAEKLLKEINADEDEVVPSMTSTIRSELVVRDSSLRKK